MLLSLTSGLLFLLLMQFQVNLLLVFAMLPTGIWVLLLFAFHGFLVDQVWDEIPTGEGLQMGTRP